jgi:cold shock protein
MTSASVREWHPDDGWGVLDCPETPGGCWAHFSHIEMDGYRSLTPGQPVDLEWEAVWQDGFDFRAVRVVPTA